MKAKTKTKNSGTISGVRRIEDTEGPVTDFSARVRHGVVNWARRTRYTLRVFSFPFLVSSAGAFLYAVLMAVISTSVQSAALVVAMMMLPGVVSMALSHRERGRWAEYAIVWVAYIASVPLYGVILFVVGYGIVFARAWRRKSPHILQSDEFDGTGEIPL